MQAESAFGALCTLANESVNQLVEKGGVELHSVIAKGPVEYPMFHPIAVISVFLEYVRCQIGNEYRLFFAKDFFSTFRQRGDIFYDSETFFIFKSRQLVIGPFDDVFKALDYWIQNINNISMPRE